MLMQIFKSVLLMSAVGSILALFLLCVAPITRKLFSPSWQYYIWLTVLITMVLPMRFSLPIETESIPTVITEHAENFATDTPQSDNQTHHLQSYNQFKKPSVPKINLSQNLFRLLSNIWILGVISVTLSKIIKYNLFLGTIYKNSEVYPCTSNLPKHLKARKTVMLDAPLIVGLFSPTLFLPNTPISENDMNYIFMHELTHYKRCDLLYKWFSAAVLSIHWFNPLVYIVSQKIDTECEISCDYVVTSSLSDNEKNNYMRMILDLLSRSKNGAIPLTTQMASSKKTIKRRFAMIRNKKSTSKFVSVTSVFAAIILFSTAIFASGIVSDISTDDYTVIITNKGKKIELLNKPFIESGEIYVPLRETLVKAMPSDEGIIDVKWNDGTIDIIVAYYQGESGMFRLKIDNSYMQLEHITYDDYINNSVEKKQVNVGIRFNLPIVLKNSTTYIPLRNINYMLYSFENKRDENNRLRELEYVVFDKNGKNLTSNTFADDIVVSNYAYNSPEYTVHRFFSFFATGHFDTMKNYCTENCIAMYFKNGSVFGIKKASLVDMVVDGNNVFVTLNITPGEISVFDKSDTSASFYVTLQPQDDGSYLIDEFSTGLN